MFEKQFDVFWNEQVRNASGQRLEMLHRDLTGTKKMLETVLLPVLGSFESLVLEYEMISLSGARIYADVFHPNLRTTFEEESFSTHAELITRGRFSFERAKARSVATFGYAFFPYGRDELEQKPEFCRRNLYEFIGRNGNLNGIGLLQLPVYSRELLRFALMNYKPFRINTVCDWLLLKREKSRDIIRDLVAEGYLLTVGGGLERCHEFIIF